MTLLDVVFKYGTPPGEKEMSALNNAWEVYGVRKIKFDEKEHTIRVEYDASRLNLTLWIDFHAARFETLDLSTRWLFLLFLALRIYLDFSGYSDMAIGYAHMMGIRLPENFNWPYIARSIDEFWRRWHIWLSSWIRDYVYIPLGGSRHGPARRIINGLVAFTICGLWHGAAWNFALWGLYHGIGLAVSVNYVPGHGAAWAVVVHAIEAGSVAVHRSHVLLRQ